MKQLKLFFFVIFILGLFSEAFAQGTASWMHTYECNDLPNVSGAIETLGGGVGSFFLSNNDPNAIFLNGDGTLTINDLTTSGNHFCTIDAASGLWSAPATVEIRMATTQSSTNNSIPIRVTDGVNSYEWWMYTDRLSGARTVVMDMTQMRVFRIKIDATGGYLYVDNGGTIEEVLGLHRSLSVNYLLWGDLFSNQTAEYIFDYVYWLTGAAYDFDTQITKISPDECGYWGYLDTDFDRDCVVGLEDIAIMAQEWLVCTNPANLECVVVN